MKRKILENVDFACFDVFCTFSQYFVPLLNRHFRFSGSSRRFVSSKLYMFSAATPSADFAKLSKNFVTSSLERAALERLMAFVFLSVNYECLPRKVSTNLLVGRLSANRVLTPFLSRYDLTKNLRSSWVKGKPQTESSSTILIIIFYSSGLRTVGLPCTLLCVSFTLLMSVVFGML